MGHWKQTKYGFIYRSNHGSFYQWSKNPLRNRAPGIGLRNIPLIVLLDLGSSWQDIDSIPVTLVNEFQIKTEDFSQGIVGIHPFPPSFRQVCRTATCGRCTERGRMEGRKESFLPSLFLPSSALPLSFSLSASRCSLGSVQEREREREGGRPTGRWASRSAGRPSLRSQLTSKVGREACLTDIEASPGHHNPRNAFFTL